jgi:hypothetical protein
MELRNRFFAGTFVGTMCLVISFVSLSALSEKVASIIGVGLVLSIAITIGVSIVLYRRAGDSIAFVLWPAIVLSLPSILMLYFSLTYAHELLGQQYVVAGIGAWLLIVLAGYLAVASPSATMANNARRKLSFIAVVGAVAPSVLSAIGILDRQAFILVFCNFTLACCLGFAASGLVRASVNEHRW